MKDEISDKLRKVLKDNDITTLDAFAGFVGSHLMFMAYINDKGRKDEFEQYLIDLSPSHNISLVAIRNVNMCTILASKIEKEVLQYIPDLFKTED